MKLCFTKHHSPSSKSDHPNRLLRSTKSCTPCTVNSLQSSPHGGPRAREEARAPRDERDVEEPAVGGAALHREEAVDHRQAPARGENGSAEGLFKRFGSFQMVSRVLYGALGDV